MGDLGKFVLAGIGGTIFWKSLDQGTKDGIVRGLGEVLKELSKPPKNQLSPPLTSPIQELVGPAEPHLQFPEVVDVPGTELSPVELLPKLQVETPNDVRWRELVPHPSVVVILGKRGSGKSSLGYRLLELARTTRPTYAVGLPASVISKLPDWLGVGIALDDIPPGSTVLIDEAYISFHARDSQTRSNKDLSQVLNLSRQRDQTLIFVTQESRQVDRNMISVADVIVFKEPSALQVQFERPEIREFAEKATAEFRQLSGNRRRFSYVVSPGQDYAGMIENNTPEFWTPALSKPFAGPPVESAKPRRGRRMPPSERRPLVRQKRSAGWSLNQIAKHFGVSKPTIVLDLKKTA